MTQPQKGDSLGPLFLPLDVPIVQGAEKTPSTGDPLLVTLGSFLGTVLIADCGSAWEAIQPGFKPLANGLRDGRAGQNIARRIFDFDPRRQVPYNDADLPALFLHRGPGVPSQTFCADSYRRSKTLFVEWVCLDPKSELKERRGSFGNAVSAALCNAIWRGNHPAWVAPADAAQPVAILNVTPGALTIQVYSGATLTGLLSKSTLEDQRFITISTEKKTIGTYPTNLPFLVRGFDNRNRAISDNVYLTATLGGETVRSTWPFARVASVTAPAMLALGGTFRVGYEQANTAFTGSELKRFTNADIFIARDGEFVPIVKPSIVQGQDPLIMESFQMTLTIVEESDADSLQRADPLEAGGGDAIWPLPDGTTFATDTY